MARVIKSKQETAGAGLGDSYLQGQLLLAMPSMTDRRFQRSVIYLCQHSDDGAMGLIINKRLTNLTIPKLLRQLELVEDGRMAPLPDCLRHKSVLNGGPMAKDRGFVLHSTDFVIDGATVSSKSGIALTASLDILKAILAGGGPEQFNLALGYSSWAPGQLEAEIQANGWLYCPADMELVFQGDRETIYDRALCKIGVDPNFLTTEVGHA